MWMEMASTTSGDRIRTDALDLVKELKGKGVVVYVVWGDSRATTRSVALPVGAEHLFGLGLPSV
jgi:cation transport ATPase